MSIEQRSHEASEAPTGYLVLMPPKGSGEQIDTSEIARRLWNGKFIILAGALAFALAAALHAFVLAQPIYRAQAVISVRVASSNGNAALGGQLGGLASLVGIDLNSQNPTRVEYVALLQSRQLVEQLIKEENLLPILFADKYDGATAKWKDPPKAPTIEDGIKRFFDRIYQVNEDTKTYLITVHIDWTDRVLAADWAKKLIDLANKDLRKSAVDESQRNMAHLERQSGRMPVESVRQSIIRLMEANLNQAMLANAQEDFALKTIDPPRIPDADKFIFPAPLLELLGGCIGGATLGAIFVLWRKVKPSTPS